VEIRDLHPAMIRQTQRADGGLPRVVAGTRGTFDQKDDGEQEWADRATPQKKKGGLAVIRRLSISHGHSPRAEGSGRAQARKINPVGL